MNHFKVSVCNYSLEKLIDWDNFVNKIETICQKAKTSNSKLLLLPEYFSLELCSMLPPVTLAEQFDQLQLLLDSFLKLFSKLAQKYKLYIAAGTFPVRNQAQHYYNRCYFFYPNGNYDFQDKCHLIRYEKSIGLIQQGTSIKTFQTELGIIAIQICYDVELPTLTQQYMQIPVDFILVPSCTETSAGLNRVQTCARARAIEQQCYVLQSGLTGAFTYCEIINLNVAQAGIYCPSDVGLVDDGLLLNTEFATSSVATAEIDLNKINFVREKGTVNNYADLQEMFSYPLELIDEK